MSVPTDLKRRLIICCDDLGMHPSINNATIDLLESEKVQSASLLAVTPSFEHAVERLIGSGIQGVGVHLALNAEYSKIPWGPLSPTTDVPSLVKPDGFFYPSTETGRVSWDVMEAEKELRRQIERVGETGLRITHLDGHLFFYEPSESSIEFTQMVSELAKSYSVPLRLRNEPTTKDSAWRTYYIWEDHDDAEGRFEYYRALLSDPPGDGEIIIHPADNLEAIGHFSNAGMRRLADYLFFSSDEFIELSENAGIEMMGWGDWQ